LSLVIPAISYLAIATVTASDLPIDLASALARSAADLGVFGRRVVYFSVVGSTNDVALAAAEQGEPEGTVYVAGAQTAGRGRQGRTWFSPPEAGLYVSTILRRRELTPSGGPRATLITLGAGIAVAEGIRGATGLPVEIKWPNDIVVAGGRGFKSRRKLAGVLAEASSGSDGASCVVLGFGINVRQTSFPPELGDRVTSIEGELGRAVDAGQILALSLASLNRISRLLEDVGSNPLVSRWLTFAPSACGSAIEWDDPRGLRRGITAGVAQDGALLARTASGIERIVSGGVRWR
jgi:BirA family biotin operon repressor/biotin-[acetyl-CoA-carboxylase] ligase